MNSNNKKKRYKPRFHDEQVAFDYVEAALWPQGPVCPHCGCTGRISAIKPNVAKRVRIGLKFCGDCRKQFTVRVGTIFEESKLPMTKWLQAIFLMVSSKKGVSAHQLHRTLETTYKTAWFLAHRIREAMRDGELAPFGSDGGMVEADETFIGVREGVEFIPPGGIGHKMKVLSLVERNTGAKRSMVLPDFKPQTIADMVSAAALGAAPEPSTIEQAAFDEPREDNDQRRGGGGNGSGGSRGRRGDLHPFIEGLLDTLPAPETNWAVEGRAKWIQAAANIFDLMYKGDGDITVKASEKNRATGA